MIIVDLRCRIYALKCMDEANMKNHIHLLSMMCYRYQLNDQYTDQNSDKNITFYSQRHPKYSPLYTCLRTSYKNSLNDSRANKTMGLKAEVHISSFRPHAHSRAQLFNRMQTLSPRTDGNYSPHHNTHLRPFFPATATQKLPIIKN